MSKKRLRVEYDGLVWVEDVPSSDMDDFDKAGIWLSNAAAAMVRGQRKKCGSEYLNEGFFGSKLAAFMGISRDDIIWPPQTHDPQLQKWLTGSNEEPDG